MTTNEKLLLEQTERSLKRTDKTLTKKTLDLMLAFQNPVTTAVVDYWDERREGLKVHFGNGLQGLIPVQELTIESLRYNNNDSKMPIQAVYLIGRKIIAAVESYDNTRNEFILSRRKSMQKRLEMLSEGDVIVGTIINITRHNIFVDCGAGLSGAINIKEFSLTHFESLQKSGFEKGDTIKAEIITISEDRINLSRRKLYPKYYQRKEEYFQEEGVNAFVASVFTPGEGYDHYKNAYWVEIEPNVPGVLNTNKTLEIGSLVEAKVTKVKRRGLKLIC